MTTIYVDNIAPNLQSKVSAPNLALPSGSVVQVVKTTNQTETVLSSTATYVDITNMSLSITPKQTNSNFLITWNLQNVYFKNSASGCSFRIVKDGTALFTPNTNYSNYANTNGWHWSVGYTHYDISTHSTLTSITFKLQGRLYATSTLVDVNDASAFLDTMIIQEIAG